MDEEKRKRIEQAPLIPGGIGTVIVLIALVIYLWQGYETALTSIMFVVGGIIAGLGFLMFMLLGTERGYDIIGDLLPEGTLKDKVTVDDIKRHVDNK